MKAMNLNKLGIFLVTSLFTGHIYSQQIHRYVLEVETIRPVTYEVKGDIHGNYTLNPQNRKKTIEYWEVLSKTPLTIQQCQDSIRLGKARRVKNPYPIQKNLTMDGQISNIWDQDIHQGDTYDEDPDLWEFLTD